MQPPEKIKKSLRIHTLNHPNGCIGCAYRGDNPSKIPNRCADELFKDVREYIQQLEAQNAELLENIKWMEAERDAAVADVRLAYTSYVGACQTCKRVKDQVDCDNPLGCGHCGEEKCKCNTCDNDYSNWEWRGVQKEE